MKKFILSLLRKPSVRYKFIFSQVFRPHPDEEMLKQALEFVAFNGVKGDYLEFGVWKGRSFTRAFNIWKFLFADKGQLSAMRFYAFDSFEGLPQASGEFKKGDYACSEVGFKNHLVAGGVDLQRVEIVKGWYNQVLNEETKKKLPIKSAAVVFIDCDIYESAVPVLNFITDYIVDGTILIFDDWFCFGGHANKGEQRAFGEWLAKNPQWRAVEYQRFNWRGNSFIIQRQ